MTSDAAIATEWYQRKKLSEGCITQEDIPSRLGSSVALAKTSEFMSLLLLAQPTYDHWWIHALLNCALRQTTAPTCAQPSQLKSAPWHHLRALPKRLLQCRLPL